MFSTVGRLLTRRITGACVHYCESYRFTGRLIHQVTRDTRKLQVPPMYFKNLEDKSLCIPMKQSPLIEQVGNKITQIELPFPFSRVPLAIDVMDPLPNAEIIDPPQDKVQEKRAARLVVIRRRKMKKHKLRKLRKKMKFEWAKVRFRRETKKEKLFQAKLIAQIKEGEQFDAAQYVTDKLKKLQEFTQSKEAKQKNKIVQLKSRYDVQR